MKLTKLSQKEINMAASKRAKAILKLHQGGMEVNELSVQLGVSKTRVQQLIEKGKRIIKDEEDRKMVPKMIASGKIGEILLGDILPTKVFNPLNNAYINTVADVSKKTERELRKYRGFGKLSLLELKRFSVVLESTFKVSVSRSLNQRHQFAKLVALFLP